MKAPAVVTALAALAQTNRLAIFRLLVQSGPEGLCVSDIASKFDLANATLSFHLKELQSAELITATQHGRFIYYAANFVAMNRLLDYLTDHCCAGGSCEVTNAKLQCNEVAT